MLGLAACSAVPMVILAVAVVVSGGHAGTSRNLEPFVPAAGLGPVLGGMLIGILLFTGFEAAASVGEECRDPYRSIPRAVIVTILLCTLFFLLMTYTLSIGYGKQAVAGGAWVNAGPTAVAEVAQQYVGGWLATLVEVVTICDALALGLAMCVSVARMVFSLGRAGLLPAGFTRRSKHGTPTLGNLVAPVATVGFIVLTRATGYAAHFRLPDGTQAFPSDEFAMFVVTATAGAFAIQLIYFALALGSVRLLERTSRAWWQYAVAVLAAATPLLGFYGALAPEPHDSSNVNWMALFYLLGGAAVCLLWTLTLNLLRRRRPAVERAVLESPDELV